MDEQGQQSAGAHPLWRRIVDFPLVAMLISVALFLAALAAGILIGKMLPPMPDLPALAVRAIIDIGLILAVYKLAIRHLGEHPRDDLKLSGSGKGLGLGLIAGFALFSIVAGIAALVDVYNIVGRGDTSHLPTALIAMAIMPGFMEEMFFRGILLRWLEEFAGSWAALLITSALFGGLHILNPGASWFSSLAIALEAGILLGGAYLLTRSLWLPMGLHAAWNFTQGFVFDVPVSGVDQHGLVQARLSGPELLSGGAFGLEASIIAMVVATGAGLWLVVRAWQRGQLIQPWWVRRRMAGTR